MKIPLVFAFYSVLHLPFQFGQSFAVLWNFDKNPDCFLSAKQWQLMQWYFIRVTYIEVTSIVRRGKIKTDASQLREHLVKNLYNQTSILYQTFTIDQDFEDEDDGHSSTLAGTLERLNNTAPWFQDDAKTKNNRLNLPSHTREDEPDHGAIVLAESVDLIDSYLNGLLRHPFNGKRSHYLLLIYKPVNHSTWRQRAGNILGKLWKVYGIMNVFIISTCNRDNVGYYDPYINVHSLGFKSADHWGLVRYVPLELFDFKDDWVLRKEWALNNHPLVASIFERYPTAVPIQKLPRSFLTTHFRKNIYSSKGMGGFDGLVMGNLAEALKFNVQLVRADVKYGRLLHNKSFIGSLGDVVHKRADVAFNSRFVIDYATDEIDFMFPVLGERVCVIAPSALQIPQWTAIFKCFSLTVWIALWTVATLSGFFWFSLKKVHRFAFRRRKGKKKTFSARDLLDLRSTVVKVWIIMLGAPIEMPARNMERLFVATCLVLNLIIAGTFQGSLYISFSTISHYKQIDTLEELDRSGLPIVTSSDSLKNLFGGWGNESPLFRSLNSKYRITGIDTIKRAARLRDVCGVERYSDIEIIIKTNYQRKDGSRLLHIVKECPQTYFLSYIVHKDWPLLHRFNTALKRFAEGGFLDIWYKETENAFIMQKLYKHPLEFERDKKNAFSLKDTQTAFYILIIGHLTALAIFACEIFVPPKDPTVYFPYLP